MDGIADLGSLHAHFGAMSTISAHKVMPRLDRYSRAFIALSPFLVLATADGEGGVDASPRGDAPGFVAMPDDTTLIIPDRPGNRRVDSFSNVIRHPGIGLIFFVPGFDETLRVNGTGRIVTDAALLAPLAAQGKIPATGLQVSITEVFFHCGKALIRSKLWDPSRHVARDSFPSLGRIVADQTAVMSAEAAEQFVAASYRERLYLKINTDGDAALLHVGGIPEEGFGGMANIDYTVPGLIVPLQQRSSMSCWATMYTMMLSWNQQQSFDERAAIAALGPTYLNAYDLNTGLPIESNRDLANAAGMVAEPLFNPSITGWYNLLLNYGLLWTSFAWRSGATSGRHIIILYGIFGDGTPTGTQVRYVDPSDGQTHTMSFMQFFPQHELGFTITALRDPMLVKFSQIMHYP